MSTVGLSILSLDVNVIVDTESDELRLKLSKVYSSSFIYKCPIKFITAKKLLIQFSALFVK